MKKLKEYLVDLLLPFILMVLLGTFFTYAIHLVLVGLFQYNLFDLLDQEKRVDAFTKIIGVAISLTGFLSIILTIIQSRRNIQREIQKNTIDLFREFRSEKVKQARNRAWAVRDKWYNNETYKAEYLKFNFDNPDNVENEQLSNDTNAIYDILEFYLIVSAYDGNKDVIKAFRYFYYGWWRPFLYEVATEIETHRKCNPLLNTYSPEYIDGVSFTKNLEKLDKMCGFQKIPRYIELHFDGG